MGEKASLESEDNAILMQYLTGGNIDSKIPTGADSGSDNSSDDSSVEEDNHFHQFAANIIEAPLLDNSMVMNMGKEDHSMDHLVFNNNMNNDESSMFYNKGRLKWTPQMVRSETKALLSSILLEIFFVPAGQAAEGGGGEALGARRGHVEESRRVRLAQPWGQHRQRWQPNHQQPPVRRAI